MVANSDTNIDYRERIADDDSYITKSDGKSAFPSLGFYSRLAKIIYSYGKMARKNKYGPKEWVDSSLDILKALEDVGVILEFSGMENLRKPEGNVMFLGNHMSTLETVVLPSIIQPVKNVTFVVKHELLSYPYFSDILRSRDPIVVGRSNPREDLMKVMNDGSRYLNSDKSIIIFPQKTRSKFFDPSSFNSLGIKLAKKNHAAVIPIALVTDAWPNGSLIKDAGKIQTKRTVHICFGEPFFVESPAGTAEQQRVIDFITSKLIEWGREDCLV
ncbi:MAG: lysophospholipid acyltransferase family protein [Bacteroidota bacterium]